MHVSECKASEDVVDNKIDLVFSESYDQSRCFIHHLFERESEERRKFRISIEISEVCVRLMRKI